MTKFALIPLVGLLLIPSLPASAQSDRRLEEKLDMILRRLERLEQHAKQSFRGPGRHDRHPQRGTDRRRGTDERRHDGRHGGSDRPFAAGGGHGGAAGKSKASAHMLGRLPDLMRAAMKGDARAQSMLAKLHKKIGGVLKASKKSKAKFENVDVRRRKVMALDVDRRRVELELAHRDLKRLGLALKQGKQKRAKIVVTDEAPKHAKSKSAKSMRNRKATSGSDLQRMQELTKKSRQLQKEIRRLRAELAEQK